MSRERRRHERHLIRLNEKKAFFRLHAGGKWHGIHDVYDVSVSGIGLRFSEALDVGTPIKISFTSYDLEIVLGAKVCWCRPGTEIISIAGTTETYRLGIEFDLERVDDNMLMFMALRKYLDAFA